MHRRKNRIVWALGRAATGIFWGLLLLLLLASAGTALANGSHIPIEAPVVLSYTPEADAVQFPVNGVITVVWDRPMLSDTNFRVTGPEGFVPGSFFYNPNVYTVTFIPDQNFAPDTRYGVLVAGQIDLEGNVQEEPLQWNFDTVTPTSVSLVTLSSDQNSQGHWWWSAWLWLMVLISVLSLAGFLVLWGNRLWRR
jgi:hypothetical protein